MSGRLAVVAAMYLMDISKEIGVMTLVKVAGLALRAMALAMTETRRTRTMQATTRTRVADYRTAAQYRSSSSASPNSGLLAPEPLSQLLPLLSELVSFLSPQVLSHLLPLWLSVCVAQDPAVSIYLRRYACMA